MEAALLAFPLTRSQLSLALDGWDHRPMAERARDFAGRLWRFARGDTPTGQFERWAYETPELEPFLGQPNVIGKLTRAPIIEASRVAPSRTLSVCHVCMASSLAARLRRERAIAISAVQAASNHASL